MDLYNYIAEKYSILGNLLSEQKEQIISGMLVRDFGLSAELALLSVKAFEEMQIMTVKMQLDSLCDYIVKIVRG